jgi:hypothetical protein
MLSPVSRRMQVVAGFVDLRAGLPGLRRLSRQLHLLDPRASCSSCRCVGAARLGSRLL